MIQSLIESRVGIIVPENHGELIWNRKKNLILRSRFYKSEIGKILYIITGKKTYGLIRLKNPEKISTKDFKKFQSNHYVSDEERAKWWPNKQILYGYRFDIIKLYKKPRNINYTAGTHDFVKDFKFLDVEEELIKDISTYDPIKANNKQLADDWRLVNAWYATKKTGGKLKHSLENIINLAGVIYREIKKRIKEEKMEHEFKPASMLPYAKELFEIVSKSKIGIMADLADATLLNQFNDKIIIKDFISVVGSYAEQREGHIPNDIDLLVRLKNPTDFIKRAIEVRMLKNLDFSDKIHFIWGEAEGPHDSFIPLYDLKLSKINPSAKIEMSDSSFKPMKPGKRFYQIPELLDYMFGGTNG